MSKQYKTLKERRIKFTSLVPALIEYAVALGYDPAIAFVKRCQECPIGLRNSLHKDCCAIDIDLYDKDGNYLTEAETHRMLGLYWESLHPQCRWGGNWDRDNKPFEPGEIDGNHYEFV